MQIVSTKPNWIPTKIVAVYAIVSGLWIFFSDSLLEQMVENPRLMARIGMMKGWLFVLVTSVILFVLIRRYMQQLRAYNVTLLEAERRFRELMEQVHMIAIMLDQQGRIVFCNDFLLQLTGWSREEILDRNWFDLFIPPRLHEETLARFREGVTSGQFTAHHENAIKTRDGLERLIVWDNTILRSATGAVAGVASLGIDVTDHRNLEMQLLQSQKMESIGTLAGGVAHDFNNILTVILSCAAMLRMKKDDPKRTQMLIDQIDGAAHRAANLTSSLLAFSRKQQISPGRIDLNEVIARMHDFLERIIGEDVILSTRLHPAGVPVLADGGQLEQVMMNLASNARDAMPQGGTLTIETSIADVDRVVPEDGSTQKGAFALLRISDTGSGIPLQDQKRVFEPFFTTKEVGKGTGLGLSMAYGIIKQHNGWMSLDSEVGTGSSFSVYLPLVERGDEPVRAAQAPAPAGDGTVLLVEDDEQVLEANRAVLQSGGYTVLAARGGQEAIDIYRQHPDRIGLAVIDVVMPDMNGRQVYDQLTALNPTLMVLFTSGYTADLLDRKNLPQGCSFMQKPQPPQEFLRLVREILQPQAKR